MILEKPFLLGKYKNGNYNVTIYSDGTRIKETINKDDTKFNAEFPDSCDMKITNQCDMGCHMCFIKGTKILMSDFSVKNIEDIKIGDEIMGFNENVEQIGQGRKLFPVKVLKTFVHVEDSLLKITTKNKNEIVSTPNHPFLASKNISSSKRNTLEFHRLEKLTTNSALCCTPFSLDNINYEAKQYKLGYLIGAWCGDGSITHSIDKNGYDYYTSRFVTLNNECNLQVYNFLQEFCDYFYINDFKMTGDEERIRKSVRSSSKKAFDFLNKLIEQNLLINENKEYCAGFLAGFFDTEGHIDKQRKIIRVCNTNKKFLDEWCRCLTKFEFDYIEEAPRLEKKSTKPIYTIRFRGNNDKNSTPMFKWAKLLQIIRPIYDYKQLKNNLLDTKMYIKDKIENIFPIIEKQYVYNLETESHTYIANNFYVHNCHENSTPDGRHAEDLLTSPIIKNLRPYTEIAIGGGNPLAYPYLINFLRLLKEKNVIPNMTVNYKHFKENYDLINYLIAKKLIYGIGVSANKIDDELIKLLQYYPNSVLHVINGLISPIDLQKLYDKNIKILILGYKNFRRGETLYKKEGKNIDFNKEWMYNNVADYITKFKVISFDELALKQIDVRSAVGEKNWEMCYQGGDGESTMFVDMVEKTFSQSSISTKRYSLNDVNSLGEALKIIQNDMEDGQ